MVDVCFLCVILIYALFQEAKKIVSNLLFRQNDSELRKQIKNEIVHVVIERCAFASLLDVQTPTYQNYQFVWNSILTILKMDLEDGDFTKVLNKDQRSHKSLLNKSLRKFIELAVASTKTQSFIKQYTFAYVFTNI